MECAVSWFDRGHPYRVRCTIDNSGIGALTNFPVRVRLSGIQPRWVDGVRFHQNNVLLKHEVDASITVGGMPYADFWVLIPSIPADDEAEFFCYLGAHAPSAEDGPAVWDANYVAVWHLSQLTGSYLDATGSAHNSTTEIVTSRDVRGIGRCAQLDGFFDYIDVPDHAAFSFTDGAGNDQPATLEAFVRPILDLGGFPSSNQLMSKASNAGNLLEWLFSLSKNGYLGFDCLHLDDTASIWRTSDAQLANGVWQHLVATYDGSESANGIVLYVDGATIASTPGSDGVYTGMSDTAVGLTIGATTNWLNGHYRGCLDEPRISKIVRSADWIAATSACCHNTYVTTHGIECRIRANRALAGPGRLAIPLTTRSAALAHVLDGKTMPPRNIGELSPYGRPGRKPWFVGRRTLFGSK